MTGVQTCALPILQNLLEVRGLGLLDIRTIFGETSVRRQMKLKLVVKLIRSSPEAFERLPVQDQTEALLGIPIRPVLLQVAAGRHLAVLVAPDRKSVGSATRVSVRVASGGRR